MLEVIRNKQADQIDYILYGELDMASCEELEEALHYDDLDNITKVQLYLSNLEFIDSTGIGQLIKYYRQYSSQNISMELVNENPEIEEILQLIGLREIIGYG